MGGREFPNEWPTVKRGDADVMVGENDTVEHGVAYYREQIAQSRAVAASMDLDSPCARSDIIEVQRAIRPVPYDRRDCAPCRPRGHHPRDPRRLTRNLSHTARSPAPLWISVPTSSSSTHAHGSLLLPTLSIPGSGEPSMMRRRWSVSTSFVQWGAPR